MTTVLFLVLNNYEWAMVNNRQSIVGLCSTAVHISVFFIAICSSSQTPLEMVPRLNPNSTDQSINQSKLSPNMKRFFTQCCQRVSISTYLC